MQADQFLIMCLNCAHPSGRNFFFLAEDEYRNALQFDTEHEAKKWCAENKNGLIAYSIISTSDFEYQPG